MTVHEDINLQGGAALACDSNDFSPAGCIGLGFVERHHGQAELISSQW